MENLFEDRNMVSAKHGPAWDARGMGRDKAIARKIGVFKWVVITMLSRDRRSPLRRVTVTSHV